MTGTLGIVAALLVVSVAGTTIGLAAGTELTPRRLTVHGGATSVPLQRCTLTAVADAEVDGMINLGTATALRVRSSVLGNRRSFVRFNLAACGLGTDDDIRAASLALVLGTAPETSRSHQARRVTGDWTETGVTSANEPAVAASATATQTTGTAAGASRTWDVVSDVRAFNSGTLNYGWRISDAAEGASTSVEGAYRSREYATAAERPTLTVNYYP